MVATCNILGETIVLGTLQTISYSLHMDRKAIRSIGNVNAKDYTQGPRTIAGSLVFAVFDKHMLYHMAEQFALKNNIYRENAYTALYSKYKSFTQNRHILSDELPPFDVTVTFANEYGNRAKLAIYGIQLLNEGQVMSINDIYTENTYQFVALDVDYLRNDDPVYNYEEETEDVEPSTPNVTVSKEYNDESTITLTHVSHDYLNSTSLLRITKISIDDNAKINDGVLYIKDLNANDDKYREYSIPSSNSNVYNKTLRLENGTYKAYFKEDITDLQTDEILIYIHDEDRGYRPIIENIAYKYNSFAPDKKIFYFKIRSICSSLYGHDKLYIKKENSDNADIFDISDNGYALVPVTYFLSKTNYSIYSGKTTSGADSSEKQMLSHIFKFYSNESFTDESILEKIVNGMSNNTEKSIMNILLDDPINSYRNEPFSAQAYLLYNTLNKHGYSKYDVETFINSIYKSEYNILSELNKLDSVAKPTDTYCVNKIAELYISDTPYAVAIDGSVDMNNDRPNKYASKYSVYYYYDINSEKNEICSCLKMKFVDRRNKSEYN